MRVQLRVESADPELLLQLRQWLAADRQVAVPGRLQWARSTDPSHMGVDIEVLTLVVNSGLTALQLALSVAQWRSSRPQPPVVVMVAADPEGPRARIDTDDPETLREAVRDFDED